MFCIFSDNCMQPKFFVSMLQHIDAMGEKKLTNQMTRGSTFLIKGLKFKFTALYHNVI